MLVSDGFWRNFVVLTVATRRLVYNPDIPRSSNIAAVHMLPLIAMAEHYSADVMRRVRNVPPRLHVDPGEDDKVINNLMTRAEHQLPSGLHRNWPGHTIEAWEEGMKILL